MKKHKCEDIGFEHYWEDITSNLVYATNPPQYPPKERRCKNCGLHQVEVVRQREIREWQTK